MIIRRSNSKSCFRIPGNILRAYQKRFLELEKGVNAKILSIVLALVGTEIRKAPTLYFYYTKLPGFDIIVISNGSFKMPEENNSEGTDTYVQGSTKEDRYQ